MNDPIRDAFEEVCIPNFGFEMRDLRRNHNDEYTNATVEDHWQTFQEGWEEAVKYLKNKDNPLYTDIVSDSGMDPR